MDNKKLKPISFTAGFIRNRKEVSTTFKLSNEARKLYREYKHKRKYKSAFYRKNYNLSQIMEMTLGRSEQKLKNAISDKNPLLEALRSKGSISKIEGGATYK
jgi:hypothetical protein